MRRANSKAASAANPARPKQAATNSTSSPDMIRLEYAGKFVAWSPDGLKIVAVASSFELAERKAAKAGYPLAAVARIPKGRTVN